jgi:hypothetical protein
VLEGVHGWKLEGMRTTRLCASSQHSLAHSPHFATAYRSGTGGTDRAKLCT